jgi:flagellar hook assembly protein FlgD
LAFELSQAQPVSLTIYNIKGQRIKSQTGLAGKSGLNTLSWDGKDATDKNCPAGIYLLRVTAGKQSYATKLIKVK